MEPIRWVVTELLVAEDDVEGEPLGKPLRLGKKNKYPVSRRSDGEREERRTFRNSAAW